LSGEGKSLWTVVLPPEMRGLQAESPPGRPNNKKIMKLTEFEPFSLELGNYFTH